jgi:hypothetical protein
MVKIPKGMFLFALSSSFSIEGNEEEFTNIIHPNIIIKKGLWRRFPLQRFV